MLIGGNFHSFTLSSAYFPLLTFNQGANALVSQIFTMERVPMSVMFKEILNVICAHLLSTHELQCSAENVMV